ncbi:hypothetical protein HW555_000988 [Spodoptera exigua]|uniref:Uncharacterized protein n=1 Tax=Spodoptera exigua TaxID=7107 RepID=A0A835GQ48_SPOEX|nr:hypothetical protein HW555_000988 [Spodoptera exigua]
MLRRLIILESACFGAAKPVLLFMHTVLKLSADMETSSCSHSLQIHGRNKERLYSAMFPPKLHPNPISGTRLTRTERYNNTAEEKSYSYKFPHAHMNIHKHTHIGRIRST